MNPTVERLEEIDRARARMLKAKAQFTAAAEAAQNQQPDAGELCAAAIQELNDARAELRRLTDAAP